MKLLPYDLDFELTSRKKRKKELEIVIDTADSVSTSVAGEDVVLQPNITIAALGNLSLLHAAVFLEDINLVSKLISRNADPQAVSHRGSPLDIAKEIIQSSVPLDRKESARNVYYALLASQGKFS